MFFKRKILFLFIFSVLLTIVAYFVENSKYGLKQSRINVEEFTSTLLNKQTILDTLLVDFVKQTSEKDVLEIFSNEKYSQAIEKQGFVYLIYEDNVLKFWSDNSLAVNDVFTKSGFEKGSVVCLDNAWVLSDIKQYNNRIYVGLILVKYSYSYENKFIQNDFQKDFKISQDVELSKIPSSEGLAVVDANREFLFSLIPDYNPEKTSKNPYLSAILYCLALLVVLLFFYQVIKYLYKIKPSNFWLIVLLADLVFIRYLMMYFNFPASFYSLEFFGPQYFGASQWLPSLGDFFINTLFLAFFAITVYKFFKFKQLTKSLALIYALVLLFFIELFFAFVVFLAKTLIYNSNISFEIHNILYTNIHSFIALLIFGLLLLSFIIICLKVFYIFKTYFSIRYLLLLLLVSLALSQLTLYIINYKSDLFSLISLIFFFFGLIYYAKLKQVKTFTSIITFVSIVALFVTGFIYIHNIEKENKIRKLLVVNLANERDPIGEIQLEEFEAKLKEDKYIIDLLSGPYSNTDLILNHLLKNYLHGYLGKYDLIITACSYLDSIEFKSENKVYNCYEFFDNIIDNEGLKIQNTNFYYLDNNNGRISYLGNIEYILPIDSFVVTLFIELNSRLISTELGYPELLLEKDFQNSNINKYSYAKYRKNSLIAQQGIFTYNLKPDIFKNTNNDFEFYTYNNFSHLVYKVDDNNLIVLSKPSVDIFNLIIAFSYIFIFFFLLSMGYFIYSSLPFKLNNFKTKIQISMISLMFLSLIFIGAISIYYNINQYQKNHFKNISEKTQSVLVELEHKLGDYNIITNDDQEYLTYLLIKFSNVFFSDINLYDLDGHLLATSRPEIFSKGLINTQINSRAFKELKITNKSEYIHKEKIGELSYLSAYVPFNNKHNKQLAYLNLPYFTKQNVLTAEISNLIIAIINIYLLLFIITTVVSLVISKSITKPLRLIQKKFQNIHLGKTNEQIIYNKQDEIGELISEYNRMMEELAKNVELLSKSERESAWREMAKQIAHEIKNPLTPMKLNIQHLQKAWENKDKNYNALHKKVTQNLVEQIDSLSMIATEFSNFAKMPKTNNEIVNVADKINNVINLFKNISQNIEIELNNHEKVNVFVDKEQLLRVFNNLINNAIQAIPADRDGSIKIELNVKNNMAIISITDNGSGISGDLKEKIFEPNFTTKTSGMGLGLAMAKNIIEDANGKIWFETEVNKGSSFYVELPLYIS